MPPQHSCCRRPGATNRRHQSGNPAGVANFFTDAYAQQTHRDCRERSARWQGPRAARHSQQEQLNAACDEAKKLGLRTLVHAYKDAVRAATLAGCTQIEHGTLATDDDLKLMAQKGTWLDPQAGLVMENYLLTKEKFLGTPGFPEEAFSAIKEIIPMYHEFMQRAVKIPGLKIVFGSDALGLARAQR